MDPNHSGRDEKPVDYVKSWGKSSVRSDTRAAAEDAAEADDKVFGEDECGMCFPEMPGGKKNKDRDDVHEERGGYMDSSDYFD